MLPDTLNELVLVLLAPATVGAVLSWLAEKAPAFQRLPKGWKTAAMPIAAFVLGGAALVLKMVIEGAPQTTVALLNMLYLAGQTGILILLGSQVWHTKFNKVQEQVEELPDLLKGLGADPSLITASRLLAALLQALRNLAEEQREGSDTPLPQEGVG